MTQIYANHPLVTRIAALRSRVRLLLALYGLGVTIAAFIGTFLLLGALDYFLHLAPAARIVLAILTLGGVAALAWKKLIMPLTTRLTDQFLASRVENVEKSLADELIAAMHFIKSGLPEHNALAQKAIETVQSRAAGVRFEDSLDFTTAARVLIGAGALVALVALLTFTSPTLAGIALGRWTDPYGNHPWPKHTDVVLDWPGGKAPAVYPLGDPLRIRAKVTRGGYKDMRAFVWSSSETQRETRDLMNFQETQSDPQKGLFVFQKELEPGEAQHVYVHVVAGDDYEARPETAATIRLAPRPISGALTAQITPPPYVKNVVDPAKPAISRTYNLLEEVARAVEGSTVRLRIKSSKPLMTDPANVPDIQLMEAGTDRVLNVPGLTRALLDPTTAELTFRAAKPLEFRLIVRDTDGFESRVAPTARLDVVPDAQPTVVIVEPRGQMTVRADAEIAVKIQATDDLGLAEVFLQADAFDAKPGDPPRFRKQLAWAAQTLDPANQTVSSVAEHRWDLKAMKLQEGDRLSFYALVRDNYAMPYEQGAPIAKPFEKSADNLVRHELVRSAALTLTIASRDKIMQNVRDDLQAIKEQIKSLHGQQTATNDRTKAIQKAAAEAGVSTPQQKDELAKLATEQNTQAQRANAIKDRIDQLFESMKTNKVDDTDLGKVAKEASEGMKDVGQKNMPTAATELSKAQESAGKSGPSTQPSGAKPNDAEKKSAEKVADSTKKADVEQEKALATMQDLMNKLDQTGAVSKARDKTNELIKRQGENLDQIRKTAAETMGLDANQLTPDQKKKLTDIKSEQDKLAKDTRDLIEQMKQDAQNLSKNDPASSESLNKAAEKGEQSNVPGQQASSGKSVQQNQMSSAASSAGAAKKGLEEMKDELDKQDQRKLEQLAKELEDLLRVIKEHREQQAAIRDDTTKTGTALPATGH